MTARVLRRVATDADRAFVDHAMRAAYAELVEREDEGAKLWMEADSGAC